MVSHEKIGMKGSPVPVLLGFNRNQHEEKHIKCESNETTILDIEEKKIYTYESGLLCSCIKNKIENKLKFLKKFYYINTDRIQAHDIDILETCIDDQEFICSAKELINIHDNKLKEKQFIELTQMVFFELFHQIKEFSNYMRIDQEKLWYYMDNHEFIKDAKTCEKTECKMPQFWMNLLNDSMIFSELLSYYKLFDNSSLYKFKKIIEFQSYPRSKISESYQIQISQSLSTTKLIESLIEMNENFIAETQEQQFKLKSFKLFIEEVKKIIYSNINYYDSSNVNHQKKKLNDVINNLNNQEANVFYGEFGILRVMNLINFNFNEINAKKYSFHRKCFINSENLWQEYLIELYFMCKENINE